MKHRPDFLRIAAHGAHQIAPGFILQALTTSPNDPAASIRVGFTVSRKVGNAVLRNRAKRRLRALADRIMTDAGTTGTDYVLIGRRETVSRDFMNMERELRGALGRINSRATARAAGKTRPGSAGRKTADG